MAVLNGLLISAILGAAETVFAASNAPTNEAALCVRALVNQGDGGRLQHKLAQARRGENIVVGVIGGSITQGAAASTPEKRYGNLVAAWWREKFPKTTVQFVNAGIGATGSDYGALRAQRDLLSHRPDFVIVEYAVNDGNTQSSAETLEGLLRQILKQPNQPAVMLLFMMNKSGGNAQEWFVKVGQHYGLPMISYRDPLWAEIQAGRMTWGDISPDEVHPNDRGHAYAARFVTACLDQVWASLPTDDALARVAPLPAPRFTDAFEHVALFEAEALKPLANEGWLFDAKNHCWKSEKPGSTIEFEIEGTMVYTMHYVVRGPMGRARVSVDGTAAKELEAWFNQTWGGYRQTQPVARSLATGKHRVRFELLPENSAGSTGHEFRILGLGAAGTEPDAPAPIFPRLMGMNIGKKHYDDPEYQKQLAKLDLVILGFYKGWRPGDGMAQVVRNLKQLSGGKVLVGQYTLMNESYDDPKNKSALDVQTKLNDMNWWARKADGSKVQWTAIYRTWDINFTATSKPDAEGRRYPEWLTERDDRTFFRAAPFDIWYCDNVFWKPRVTADWDGDGHDDKPDAPAVASAYRAGHQAEWQHIRKIHPGLPIMGNTDGDLSQAEYKGQLQGAFLEGLMGLSWSIEKWAGWDAAMKRYRAVMANTCAPHWVGFNAQGKPTDYPFFRYAYASCLLDDGYFCFTDRANEYSSVVWFDEFDFKLGPATTPPPGAAWQNGVWRRDFANGIALVNPTKEPATITLEPGFRRLRGQQAPDVNNGDAVTSLTLNPKDGIILRK